VTTTDPATFPDSNAATTRIRNTFRSAATPIGRGLERC
jgi:hypothetical protein